MNLMSKYFPNLRFPRIPIVKPGVGDEVTLYKNNESAKISGD